MKAVLYDAFRSPPRVEVVPDPEPVSHGAVIRVKATGVCRSDWHGWMGHDPTITLPHVPGHELAGVIEEVGREVTRWKPGDRVTVPFVCGCGTCPQCRSGNHQVCDNQTQPGFTHWGSFAELVSIHRADVNLVRLPETIDFTAAASLGCRFVTSFRAVIDQGRVSEGDQVAVHGCGGVGLSAVMIAAALGARVVAVDISDDKLDLARAMGAAATVNAAEVANVAGAIVEMTGGGAHVSLDALGHPATCFDSVSCLRKRGRHVQVGLLVADDARTPIPMDRVVADELEIVGSHGIQAHRYDAMFAMIESGRLSPGSLVGRTIGLDEAADVLVNMNRFGEKGVAVVTEF